MSEKRVPQIKSFDRAMQLFAAVEKVAGYAAPREMDERFEKLREAIKKIPRQKPPAGPDWDARFRAGLLGHVQESLCASRYHLDNVTTIERELVRVITGWPASLEIPSGSSMGGGNMRRLHYEYQAFAFAIRRTLDHLATAVGAYFQVRPRSIKTLRGAIANSKPRETVQRICKVVDSSLSSLSDVVTLGQSKTVRDRLAHFEAVNAGILNIAEMDGKPVLTLAGGGHALRAGFGSSVCLTPLLVAQFDRVFAFVWEVIDALGVG